MRDEKAPDNVPRATGPPARQPSFDRLVDAKFSYGLRPGLRPSPSRYPWSCS